MSIPMTTWIIIGVSFAFSGLIFMFVWRKVSPLIKSAKGMMAGMASSNALLATGTPAEAKVLKVKPTNALINHMPVVEVDLEVQPRYGKAYPVKLKSTIPQIHLPRVQPNAVIQVKVDPGNPQHVALAL